MVDKDLILVRRYGKIIKLDAEAQVRKTGQAPDVLIKAKGKLLTLSAEQMMDYGVADLLLLPEKLAPITEEERAEGRWPASKMLLFQQPFFKEIPQALVETYKMSWQTKFFALLATPLISSLLVLGLMIGFYVEISSPGFGLAAMVALTCLFLLILSNFALQLVGWLEIIMLLTGLLIVFVELFIVPTFGILGFVGLLLFIGGLFSMLLPSIGSVSFEVDSHSLNAAGQVFVERLAWLAGTLIVGVIIIMLLTRYVMPKFGLFQRLVLHGEQDASKGYIAGEDPVNLPPPGSPGEVLATLRPAGKVIIHDNVYDVVSAGGFIEKGERIVVLRLDGSKIVVTKETP